MNPLVSEAENLLAALERGDWPDPGQMDAWMQRLRLVADGLDEASLRVLVTLTKRLEEAVRAHRDQPDLLMLGTAGRVGIGRLVQPSVAEPVSRRWGGPSLVVPEQGKKLVDARGRLNLTRVVVPIDTSVDQQPVVDTLVRVLDHLGAGSVAFTLVHVGDRKSLPTFELPPRSDWMWRTEVVAAGSVVDGILAIASHADTAGRALLAALDRALDFS